MMLEGKTDAEQHGLVSGEADCSPDNATSQGLTQSGLTPLMEQFNAGAQFVATQ